MRELFTFPDLCARREFGTQSLMFCQMESTVPVWICSFGQQPRDWFLQNSPLAWFTKACCKSNCWHRPGYALAPSVIKIVLRPCAVRASTHSIAFVARILVVDSCGGFAPRHVSVTGNRTNARCFEIVLHLFELKREAETKVKEC